MRPKPSVVYWNNIPSPYMVERFNALADRRSLEFEAWFNGRLEADRSWAVDESRWRFRYRYLPSTRLLGRRISWPLPTLTSRTELIVSLYAEPVFLVGWAIAKLRGIRTGFWVMVTFDSWVKRRRWKERLKRLVLPRADRIITAGSDGTQFAEHYGVARERIALAPHAIDVGHFSVGAQLVRTHREEHRRGHGLRGVTFVYVGRLWSGKGLMYLLEAFARVQEALDESVSLLIVGDGSDEGVLRGTVMDSKLQNVVFAGFRQKPELPLFYGMSDVFVFPTLGDPYGLVVDEAMASSLPVISTSAAGEVRDRVKDGINGFIVPPADSAALAASMLALARDPELRTYMGRRSFEMVSGHTPDMWARNFEDIVLGLLRPNRTT